MDVNYAELAATAVKPEQYPASGLPEFAFIGKSNVGKSSLLNALAGRKALARISGSPGKTRAINFFNIDNICLFVDLPGYGYAKVSRKESEKWGIMADRYLLNRKQLIAVFMLLDIRHDPSALDRQMLEWLEHYCFEVITVATKIDKIKRSAIPTRLKRLRASARVSDILAFSSETRDGREKIWDIILNKIQKPQDQE
ncbi:MAG: ribosome biogenesis GTP-binding protein YihA/YsxC [Clostridiales bacterium]|jgi:GTP-binding protein|nr:ribosome biogenesis GTP-binding protein YihA/YsxC [Clostridiales bacterium]